MSKRIISFASGSIWRHNKGKNRNESITYIKGMDLDGLEITFDTKQTLYDFRLSKSNEKWLRTLPYVTIHAPFRLVRLADNIAEVIKQLDIINDLYKRVRAKRVIIHPLDLEPKEIPGIIKKYHLNVTTENEPKNYKVTIPRLKQIMKRYPGIKICLDTAHAYTWSKEEVNKLITAFRNKIGQVHFSVTYRGKHHQPLEKATKNFLYSVERVKELKVPIVIEEDLDFISKKFLQEEITRIKNFFMK